MAMVRIGLVRAEEGVAVRDEDDGDGVEGLALIWCHL